MIKILLYNMKTGDTRCGDESMSDIPLYSKHNSILFGNDMEARACYQGTTLLLALLCVFTGGCAHYPETPQLEQVERLREVAGRLLREAPAFQRLLSDL